MSIAHSALDPDYCWPGDPVELTMHANALCAKVARAELDEFGRAWDVQLRHVWSIPPEMVVERYLVLTRLMAACRGSEADLYKPELQRKSFELLARIGKVDPKAKSVLSPPESEFLEWVAWWELGDTTCGPPELSDSVFASFCCRLVDGDHDPLYKSLKRSTRKDERLAIFRVWAAEELCESFIGSHQWKKCQSLAHECELRGYYAYATHRLDPAPLTSQWMRYRHYRVQRLVAQLSTLGATRSRRWTRELERLVPVITGSECANMQEVGS